MKIKFIVFVLLCLVISLLSACGEENTTTQPTVTPTQTLIPMPPVEVPTTVVPTVQTSVIPTVAPTVFPSEVPTTTPSTVAPTQAPTVAPTTLAPTVTPTVAPTQAPTTSQVDMDNAIFASPNGDGYGTIDSPYSLTKALERHSSQKTLYLLEGTYNLNAVIRLKFEGIAGQYRKIFAYPGHNVIFDFGVDYTKNPTPTGGYHGDANKGIIISGNYYHIKGITVRHCRSTGITVSGDNNIVEECVTYKNGNSGLVVQGNTSETFNQWPKNNLVKNCTSWGNIDWDRTDSNIGEDADGFCAKLCAGPGNVFDGCIAFNNSDDGWDLFTKHKSGVIGSVTLRNCVAFRNGYGIDGTDLKNGQGFKLGGRALAVDHFVENCVAFYNKANGFDDNSNPGTITITNCTSFQNGKRNYSMGRFTEEINTYTSTWYEGDTLFGPIENVEKSHHVFKNCISYDTTEADQYVGQATNSYFSEPYYYHVFDQTQYCSHKYIKGDKIDIENPFISTSIDVSNLEMIHYMYRNSDGTVNLRGFLELNDYYKAKNLGANL